MSFETHVEEKVKDGTAVLKLETMTVLISLTIWNIKLLRTPVTVLPISLSSRNWMIMHNAE